MTEPWEIVGDEPKTERTPLDDKIEEELLKHSVVILNGEIKEEVVNRICKQIVFLGYVADKKKPITVVLNSVGGEVFLGLLIYNSIEDLKKKGYKIIVEVRGLAASMGCIILQAGTIRRANKYSRLLIHEITSYTYGKASEVKEAAEETLKVNAMLREIIAERSGKSPEEIEKQWHKTDLWLSAEEAKVFGLVDEVT